MLTGQRGIVEFAPIDVGAEASTLRLMDFSSRKRGATTKQKG